MVVKENMPWLRMLFSIRGDSLRRTLPHILVVTALAVVVTTVEIVTQSTGVLDLTTTPFTLIGLALSIFLGFRNNAAYDRYWEGRKLWGQLVNSARTFARQSLTLICPPQPDLGDEIIVREFQESLIRRMIAYVHALRHLLRDTDPFPDLERFLDPADVDRLRGRRNVPIALLEEIAIRIHEAWRDGWVSEYHLPVLEKTLVSLTDIQGGCERIKNTPIPWAYTVLIHRIVAFYCFFLPFGIVNSVGWLTPIVVLLISHAFFGLDEVADEIEQPFGLDAQDLPLTSLCRTVEVDLLQAIHHDDLPDALLPIDGILV